MLAIALLLIFAACFILFLAIVRFKFDDRPTLNIEKTAIEQITAPEPKKAKGPLGHVLNLIRGIAFINKPLTIGPLGQRIARDLGMAKLAINEDEFLLAKEILMVVILAAVVVLIPSKQELFPFFVLIGLGMGYFFPEFWLRGRIKSVKNAIIKDLPDTVDLLGLCVNAGLDFMMALKYVIDKSAPSILIEEFKGMIQEINVGKPRRDALRDLARKYELPDLSTFSRTLIQADRMGTSVSDALNILSEDMRDARFRRGETMAMKAPLKMLIPLLLFIFPVVAILVAGPVFLDFFQNNPLQKMGR